MTSLIKHRRPHEGAFAVYTLGLGLWIALPTEAMGTRAYTAITQSASELQWGLMFMALGAAHGLAVYVNGSRWWTPFARAATSAAMAMGYGALLFGFWWVVPTSTAVPNYAAMTAASMWCLYQAAHDCGVAMARWKNA